MQRRRSGFAGLLTVLVAGACTSADGGALEPVSIAPAPSVTSPATLSTPTTTITPPTTTTTSAPGTSAPTETSDVDPTTTVQTSQDPVEAITAAVETLEQSWKACLAAVPNCDFDLLRDGRSGDLLGGLMSAARNFGLQGLEVRQTEQIEFDVESVDIGDDGLTATITMCVTDSSILVEPTDTGDRIVNDDFISIRYTQDFELRDDQWVAIKRESVGEAIRDRQASLCAT